MISAPEVITVLGTAAIVLAPWVLAAVLAVKDALRRPTWASFLVAAVVLVGATPAAVLYLAYRAWRGPAPRGASESTPSSSTVGASR